MNEGKVTFKWKDYRSQGRTRHKQMTLTAGAFMRRFLLHVLPGGFHRIRHYGLIANSGRKENLARIRALLIDQGIAEAIVADKKNSDPEAANQCNETATYICRHCGGPMVIIESFVGGQMPRAPPVSIGASS